MAERTLQVLQFQWGWITPGTGEDNRQEQWDHHLAFLEEPVLPRTRHLLFCHCGWWLDSEASARIRRLTGSNPEPNRALTPCSSEDLAQLAAHVQNGRLEAVAYPYAACVAEATSAEALLRQFRLSMEIAEAAFDRRPRLALNHDAIYGLDWGAELMPQIARLLDLEVLLAGRDAWVEAADGSRVRLLGEAPFRQMLHLGPGERSVFFHPLELHNSVGFQARWPAIQEEFPALRDIKLEAVGLDTYLSKVQPRETVSANSVGHKNWFGGTIDGLVLQQAVKSTEVRLTALEAILAQQGELEPSQELLDHWKAGFILLDNHTIWQLHDYKRHYLPAALARQTEAATLEQQLLGHDDEGDQLCVFNAVPTPRDLTVEQDGKVWHVPQVAGWATATLPMSDHEAPEEDDDPFTLANNEVTYQLDASGAISRIDDAPVDRWGRLVRLHEAPAESAGHLNRNDSFACSGAGCLTTTFALPEPQRSVMFHACDLIGEAMLLEAERLDADGKSLGIERVPLHNLHWGSKGLPRHESQLQPRQLDAYGASRLRLTIWVAAEGTLGIGDARVWLEDCTCRRIDSWTYRPTYDNAVSEPSHVEASVVRATASLKTVRFTGQLPDCHYRLDITLRRGSRALEHRLAITFPEATALGFRSPPFERREGSLFGTCCERPYLPALAILLPTADDSRFYSDKPGTLRQAFQPADATWHNDVQDWWWGMSTFIGQYLAIAETDEQQAALLTRGLHHFFRWRHGGDTLLGLSLGATLIHHMTQGHSAPPESPWHKIIRRNNFDPYGDTPFLDAEGRYVFHYAIAREAAGPAARQRLHAAADSFALPPVAVRTTRERAADLPGLTCEPAHVIVTALEPAGDGVLLRLCNRSQEATTAKLRLPWPLVEAAPTLADSPTEIDGQQLQVTLPPTAYREIRLVPELP